MRKTMTLRKRTTSRKTISRKRTTSKKRMILRKTTLKMSFLRFRIRKTLKETWKLKNHLRKRFSAELRSQKEAEFHLIPDLL